MTQKPTTENLTATFQKILHTEGIAEVNFLDALEGNRVLIKVGVELSGSNGKLCGSISRVIGSKGVGIRLIKHILETEFGIEDPRISVLEQVKGEVVSK